MDKFRQISTELWPLIDVINWFSLSMFGMSRKGLVSKWFSLHWKYPAAGYVVSAALSLLMFLVCLNLVISSIPNYLNNSETPIIYYKYKKPIRSTMFNFNKIVTGITIDSNTPDSWDSHNYNYLYPSAGHVLTGNLNVIPDARVRNIIFKGPKYRFKNSSATRHIRIYILWWFSL